MEEMFLQNPGAVPSPKVSFGKRAAAKLGIRLPQAPLRCLVVAATTSLDLIYRRKKWFPTVFCSRIK
ncbi:hypothetical protein GRJ2_002243700 [Grus japonensis]|uniref:Uncharacterized protein n=1 Tax=Grus japonensis TaxID=30415 RepID=A0ABC9XJC5_GRUJA